MLKLDWQWIRVGTRVLVHDAMDPVAPLRPGVVTVAERSPRRTRVGVRLMGADGSTSTAWPSITDVHLDPRGDDDSCWRCDEAAEGAHTTTALEAHSPVPT